MVIIGDMEGRGRRVAVGVAILALSLLDAQSKISAQIQPPSIEWPLRFIGTRARDADQRGQMSASRRTGNTNAICIRPQDSVSRPRARSAYRMPKATGTEWPI